MVEAMKKMFRSAAQGGPAPDRPAQAKADERSPIKKTIILPNGSSFTRLNRNVLDLTSGKTAKFGA